MDQIKLTDISAISAPVSAIFKFILYLKLLVKYCSHPDNFKWCTEEFIYSGFEMNYSGGMKQVLTYFRKKKQAIC